MCTDPAEVLQTTWRIELVVDVLWTMNMSVSFFTAFYKDVELINNWRETGRKYMREGFLTDFLSTAPMLVTWYAMPWAYYFKLLRLYQIGRAQRIIKAKVLALEHRFQLSK